MAFLNAYPENSVMYLSDEDFWKVKQFYTLESADGTLPERLFPYAMIKEQYGYLPKQYAQEKRELVEKWGFAWKCRQCLCVNVDTGETFSAKDVLENKGEWISL